MLMCRQLVAARTPDRRAARARAPSRPKSAIPGSGPVGAATVAVEARRQACGLGACRPAGLGHAPAEPPGTSRLAGPVDGVFKGPRGGIFQSVTATGIDYIRPNGYLISRYSVQILKIMLYCTSKFAQLHPLISGKSQGVKRNCGKCVTEEEQEKEG